MDILASFQLITSSLMSRGHLPNRSKSIRQRSLSLHRINEKHSSQGQLSHRVQLKKLRFNVFLS